MLGRSVHGPLTDARCQHAAAIRRLTFENQLRRHGRGSGEELLDGTPHGRRKRERRVDARPVATGLDGADGLSAESRSLGESRLTEPGGDPGFAQRC